jgi:hypothetical protein
MAAGGVLVRSRKRSLSLAGLPAMFVKVKVVDVFPKVAVTM